MEWTVHAMQVLGLLALSPTQPHPHSSLTLIADEPGPAIGAVTAVQAGEAGSPIPAVIAGQAAVWAKGIVQADWRTDRERGLRAWPLAWDPTQRRGHGASSGHAGPTRVNGDKGANRGQKGP